MAIIDCTTVPGGSGLTACIPDSSDNASRLNAYFTYAKNNNHTIYIPEGTYKFGSNLYIDSIKVFGEKNTFLVPYTSGSPKSIYVKGTDARLFNFTVKADYVKNSGRPSALVHAIRNDGDDSIISLTIEKVTIEDYPGMGIEIGNQKVGKIEVLDCETINCFSTGIYFGTSKNISIKDCYSEHCFNGIQIWGMTDANPTSTTEFKASKILISGCTTNNKDYKARSGSDPNWDYGYETGIFLTAVEEFSILNNYCYNVSDVGIDFEYCRNGTIDGNVSKNAKNGAYAIFYGSENLIFSDNIAIQNVEGSTSAFFGPGFYVNYNSTYGLKVKDCNITNNIFICDKTSGFYSDTESIESCKLDGNIIKQKYVNNEAGIAFNKVLKSLQIINNKIEVYQARGISLDGVKDSQISNNVMLCNSPNSDSIGLLLYHSNSTYPCLDNTITGNRIKGFTRASIEEDNLNDLNNPSYSYIAGNRVETIKRRNGNTAYASKVENNYHVTGSTNPLATVNVTPY